MPNDGGAARADELRIAVVACTKAKLRQPTRAVDLYSPSPLFKKSCEQAAADGLPVVVLSTKYGLVDGNTIIAPYERTFESMSPAERREWDALVEAQVDQVCREKGVREVVFFAGAAYREAVAECFQRRGVKTSAHPRWKAICNEAFGR